MHVPELAARLIAQGPADSAPLASVPRRALLAWLRGWAYLESGVPAQAVKDAKAAVAFSKPDPSVSSVRTAASMSPDSSFLSANSATSGPSGSAAAVSYCERASLSAEAGGRRADIADGMGGGTWPAAYLLLSAAQAAAAEAPEQGLVALLARRAEERLPEFLRPRPRWHYYNEWMRTRIAAAAPGLPEPVVEKLLAATDANDLDLMLQHPLTLLAQADEYRQVLDAHGARALLSYEAEPLSWDEMQAVAGGGLVGLPLGYDATATAALIEQCHSDDDCDGGSVGDGRAKAIRYDADALAAAAAESGPETAEGSGMGRGASDAVVLACGSGGSTLMDAATLATAAPRHRQRSPLVGTWSVELAQRSLQMALQEVELRSGCAEGVTGDVAAVEPVADVDSDPRCSTTTPVPTDAPSAPPSPLPLPPDPRSQPPPTPQQPLMAVLRDLASISNNNHLTDSFDATRRRRHSMYEHPLAPSPPGSPPQRPPSRDSESGTAGDALPRRRASDSNAYIAPVLGGAGRSGPPPAVTAAAMRAVAGMQEMDEYSLVAAARQRQRRTAHGQGRSASVQPYGGGSGGGSSSGAAAAALAGASRKGGMGPHISLRSLMASRSMGSLPVLLAARRGGPGPGPATAADHELHSPLSPSGSSASLAAALGRLTGKSFQLADIAKAAVGASGASPFTSTTAVAAAATSPGTPTLPPVALPSRNAPLQRSFTGVGGSSAASGRSGASSLGGAVLAPGRMAASDGGMAGGGPGGGPADEAAAAAAAVRALAERFGTVLPAEGLLEAEAELAFRERSKRLMEAGDGGVRGRGGVPVALVAANPAAYQEEAAEAAEAAYRALSERAKFRLKVLLEEASTGQAPWRHLEDAMRELTSHRPFFLPPVLSRPKFERPQLEAPKAPKQTAWNANDSIFAQRKKENEARDLYDTDKIRSAQLMLDWKRVVGKTRFRRMIARGDAGVRNDGQSLEEELGEVREELERQADFIRSAFTYYSMMGGVGTSSDVLQMAASAWMAFCHDAGIIQPGATRGSTAQDMQASGAGPGAGPGRGERTIFIAVNFEEESETVEADANDDDAMVRFEFMEGLVRAAFGKYITSKRMTDASDAVGALLEEVSSSPNLPPEARVDPNEFRRSRFYLPEVEEVVKEYYDLLAAMFKLYKARDRAKYFWPEHWFAFLEANQLLGLATGVERREAKLIYAWSQCVVTDELRRRQRAVSLTLWDFIEAVARLADLMSPPDHEFLIGFFVAEGQDPPELERLTWEYYRLVGDAGTELKRLSAELLGPFTRPLAPKLRLLLEYLTCSLRDAWGGRDAKDVAGKVAKMATYLSGGIEMG
ncbi:hypothetical protein GPECTOR_2g1046 [Gonium pectorale]|uniref:Uncharacterized protein n=1 Tax=Gonium pectorale TaxID=33097 RepID=A0A150H003_GONPE|nr:hypothetical protein GPECTOR_2g1046 [Gonium pectorale]|eukprot:KXZ55497.1 hypothetical protein GPECTOR_2g1046 [Gonium pectorale]